MKCESSVNLLWNAMKYVGVRKSSSCISLCPSRERCEIVVLVILGREINVYWFVSVVSNKGVQGICIYVD